MPGHLVLALAVLNKSAEYREAQGRNITVLDANGLQTPALHQLPSGVRRPPGWYTDGELYPHGIARVVAFFPWDRNVPPAQIWWELGGTVRTEGLAPGFVVTQGRERTTADWSQIVGSWLRSLEPRGG
jgi:hypothetical protein